MLHARIVVAGGNADLFQKERKKIEKFPSLVPHNRIFFSFLSSALVIVLLSARSLYVQFIGFMSIIPVH